MLDKAQHCQKIHVQRCLRWMFLGDWASRPPDRPMSSTQCLCLGRRQQLMIHAASKFNGALPICRYLCAESNVRGIADSFSKLGMKSPGSVHMSPLQPCTTLTMSKHKGQCKKLWKTSQFCHNAYGPLNQLHWFLMCCKAALGCIELLWDQSLRRRNFIYQPRPLLNLLSMASQKLAANVLGTLL